MDAPATYADGKLTTEEIDDSSLESSEGCLRIVTDGGVATYEVSFTRH